MSDTVSELKPLLQELLDLVHAQSRELAEHGERLARLETGQAVITARLDEHGERLARLETGQAVITARLDEQRAVLTALIPTRLAAVGSESPKKPAAE